MYVWSTFLPILFSMHSHLLLDPTGTWSNLPFLPHQNVEPMRRWTGTPPLSMSLWFQAWSWTRGVGTHGLLASQLPQKLGSNFDHFCGTTRDHYSKWIHHPNPSDIGSNWNGEFTLPEAKRIAPWSLMIGRPLYLFSYTFISECCKKIPGCKNMFSVIKQVFFSKKDLEETKGTEASPWFGRYRCHQKVDGWVADLAWRNLGIAEERCSPETKDPPSPWNPMNISQTWFYRRVWFGYSAIFLHQVLQSDLVWNHSCDLFFWLFSVTSHLAESIQVTNGRSCSFWGLKGWICFLGGGNSKYVLCSPRSLGKWSKLD